MVELVLIIIKLLTVFALGILVGLMIADHIQYPRK